MDKDQIKKYSEYPREEKIITELKDNKKNVIGKEQFKLNADGNLLYSFKWDIKGNFISAEQYIYNEKGRLKKYYSKMPSDNSCHEYFYGNKGYLIKEKITINMVSTNDKYSTTIKYDKNGKQISLKEKSELYDENGKLFDVTEYEEDNDN